jgi:hypothetical protein
LFRNGAAEAAPFTFLRSSLNESNAACSTVSTNQEAVMSLGQLLDVASRLLTAFAIILGGGWVLFNYFAGRTHRPRLQLRVSGERILRDGLEYLLIRTELSNVGLARVKLVSDGCTTTIYAHELPMATKFVMEPGWARLAAFELFRNHQWVGPAVC